MLKISLGAEEMAQLIVSVYNHKALRSETLNIKAWYGNMGVRWEKKEDIQSCWSDKLMKDPISKPKPNQQP